MRFPARVGSDDNGGALDAQVTVLSSGSGSYYGGSGTLTAVDGGVTGVEANGVIEVEGTF